ncbi:XAC2610-related protein [Pseudomonas syringae]|uniref:XAC2610-related protein n=1 Tax=Pseudomonas syringae TaxID=317 RepID=UPI003F757D1E
MHLSIVQRCVSRLGLQALLVFVGLSSSTLVSAAGAPPTYGEMGAAGFAGAPRDSYTLQDFSDKYRATLDISAGDDVFRPGVINVYDKASGAALIRVQSDELVLGTDPKTGKVKTNVHELPYGEQSVLIYQDFNFDGIKDLALMDGQNSCYHGPSFQVFLGTADGFRHSDSFTELAQNNCGLFSVDEKKREIETMTKSGCCWHQMSTYSVRNGEPVLETQTVIDHTGGSGLPTETVSRNQNGKMTDTTSIVWEEDEQREILLSFRLAPSGKRIVLFRSGPASPVFYAAVDSKNKVGLLFPQAEGEQLKYDDASHVLSFVRGDTVYRIVADAKGSPKGMQVLVRGKTTDLKLLAEPAQGSLNKVAEALKTAQ